MSSFRSKASLSAVNIETKDCLSKAFFANAGRPVFLLALSGKF
jgi:hypothetical protein